MAQTKTYKYLGYITCLYIAFQLISDVTAGKIINIFSYPVSVSVIYFPVTFVFSDILTEVYGYGKARSVLWIVMGASILAGLVYALVILLPPGTGFQNNEAYSIVLGQVPRVLIGGWIAVFTGELANNYVLAKMKILTKGKYLWTRIIGSTIVGQFVNTTLFFGIGLSNELPTHLLIQAILAGWITKVLVEAIFAPVTYVIIKKLKREEQVDYYDIHTKFTPFVWDPPF